MPPPLKLYSWNVNGFRSVVAKTFDAFLAACEPDILCLQEIKLNAGNIPAPPETNGDLFDGGAAGAAPTTPLSRFPCQFWHIADKPGYSGTAILSRVAPLAVTRDFVGDPTREGRVLNAEFVRCFVVCAYVPNAKEGLARLDFRLEWDAAFRRHLAALAAKKPVFVCGDLNVAHNEIDLENPAANRRNAGFTDEERGSFSELLAQGFADTFRETHPAAARRYSWWSYRAAARARNVGWRIDYWLASRALDGRWRDPEIHDDIGGSDHCPVSILADAALF